MTNSTNQFVIDLDEASQSSISLVGGKALSLAQLRTEGFDVPPGFVVATPFFADWDDLLDSSSEWRKLSDSFQLDAPLDFHSCEKLCTEIQRSIEGLEVTTNQRTILNQLMSLLTFSEQWVVRSSGVAEDLPHLSFAGMYESFIGVRCPDVERALKDCFKSAFAPRVIKYKHENGIPLELGGIGVLVQQQVDCDISGVAFSINPTSNDFDEILINVHSGMGEDLVGGLVTPESWTVNKYTREVVDYRNSAEDQTGGSVLLSDSLLESLIDTVVSVEQYRGEPVDMEVAIADSRVQVVQARPITNWVPLPNEMQTEPGQPRRLYVDPSLADGITMAGAVSPLTADFHLYVIRKFAEHALSKSYLDTTVGSGFMFTSGVRLYMNLSLMLDYFDPKQFADQRRLVDVSLAELYATVDFSRYRANLRTVKGVALLIANFMKAFWSIRATFGSAMQMLFKFDAFHRKYLREVKVYEDFVNGVDSSQPIKELIDSLLAAYARVAVKATLPALYASVMSGTFELTQIAKKQSSETAKQLIESVKAGGSDLVRDMGIEMYRLAHLLPQKAYEDLKGLEHQLQTGVLNHQFLSQWQAFNKQFGCRGPLEMDLARPKYRERPALLLQQLGYMRSESASNPAEVLEQAQVNRDTALRQLGEHCTKRTYRKIWKAHQVLEALQHSREMPKHQFAMMNVKIRERLIQLGEEWNRMGRLDDPNDIFELKIDEIAAAESDPSFDLCDKLTARKATHDRLKRVRHFPHMIDSRGRILRPIRPALENQWNGTPVSPGVARGIVNVVHDPTTKSVQPGDILVAYTTDPGWTPLFVDVAAIVLEVGGELQHGALVAREYGKPCVAGVVGAVDDLQDGQIVEVDGSSGSVTLLDDKDLPV